jgi:tRNA G18 (ribose-2'-O)-methylase SpoU
MMVTLEILDSCIIDISVVASMPLLEVFIFRKRYPDRPSIKDLSPLSSCPRLKRLWLFGNEGAGLDPRIDADTVQWIRIPQSDRVESLNVAAAAAVCLFEQRRQRAGA